LPKLDPGAILTRSTKGLLGGLVVERWARSDPLHLGLLRERSIERSTAQRTAKLTAIRTIAVNAGGTLLTFVRSPLR
jgi:hypothetical protein